MDRTGVAVRLATLSIVCAAVLFAAERLHTGPMNFLERHFGFSPGDGEPSCSLKSLARHEQTNRYISKYLNAAPKISYCTD
jgi:hypothetical protein